MRYISRSLKEPTVLATDDVIYFDVDETLIFWRTDEDPNDPIIEVVDPYIPGKTIKLVPHQRHIDMMLRNYGQGKTIVVWSAGGCLWAENVVKALGLDNIVSLIIKKPDVYVDDLDIKDWGLNRVYLAKDLRGHPWQKDKKKK